MEAVPRMPMVAFDLKSSSVTIDFGQYLKPFIAEHYNEDPSAYSKECQELNQLRQNAIKVSRDFVGCSTLKKYYCQLLFLQSRFPLSEMNINFIWEDVYTGKSVTSHNVQFEMACVLNNIAALHSYLGAADNRSTPEGMKVSCTHFQCAAWALQQLRDKYGGTLSPDMAPNILTFQINLMLAQAQECILEKSMTDNRKSTITAKVAAQIVDYYCQATKNLESGKPLDIIGNRKYKDWRRRLDLKTSYHQCIQNFYMGNQCEEQQKWGERLAYFQAALDRLNDCIKIAKFYQTQDVLESILEYTVVVEEDDFEDTMKFTMDVVGGKYNAAKKDNEFIYHEKVPAFDSLPEVKGASLVKGIPFNTKDPEISGADIFQRLVPMEAHEASSLYSEEKAKLLRSVASRIQEKNEELEEYESSLKLDPNRLLPERERLPQVLLEKCAAISVKPNAIKDLVAAMQELSNVATDVETTIKEADELLERENTEDKEFKELIGKKQMANVTLEEIVKELDKYREGLMKASNSNMELHKAMHSHIANLKILSGPLEDLEQALPAQPEISEEDQATVDTLSKLLCKVKEMRDQRAMLEQQLRHAIQGDDITTALVTRQDQEQSQDDFFREQLKKHDKTVQLIDQNLLAQGNILKALTEANAQYAKLKKSLHETNAKREGMIQGFIQSYDVYEDLLAKSKKGIDFYKKLEQNVNTLLERTKRTCKTLTEERDSIMARIAPKGPPPARPTAPKPGQAPPVVPGLNPADMAAMGLSPGIPGAPDLTMMPPGGIPASSAPSGGGLKLKDYLPFMKPNTFGTKLDNKAASLSAMDRYNMYKGVGLNQVPGVPSQMGPSQPGSLPASQSASPIHISGYSSSLPTSPAQSRTATPPGALYQVNEVPGAPGQAYVPYGQVYMPQGQSQVPQDQSQMPQSHPQMPQSLQPPSAYTQQPQHSDSGLEPARPESAHTVNTIHGPIASPTEAPSKTQELKEDLPLPPGYCFTHPDPPAAAKSPEAPKNVAATNAAGSYAASPISTPSPISAPGGTPSQPHYSQYPSSQYSAQNTQYPTAQYPTYPADQTATSQYATPNQQHASGVQYPSELYQHATGQPNSQPTQQPSGAPHASYPPGASADPGKPQQYPNVSHYPGTGQLPGINMVSSTSSAVTSTVASYPSSQVAAGISHSYQTPPASPQLYAYPQGYQPAQVPATSQYPQGYQATNQYPQGYPQPSQYPKSQISYPQTTKPGYSQTTQSGYSKTSGYPQNTQAGYSQPTQTSYPQTSQVGYSQTTQPGYPQTSQYPQNIQAGYSQTTQVAYPQTTQAGYPQPTQGYQQATQTGYPQTTQAGYPQSTQAGYPQTTQNYPQTTQAGVPQTTQGYPKTTQAGYPQTTQAGYPQTTQAGYPQTTKPNQAFGAGYPQTTQVYGQTTSSYAQPAQPSTTTYGNTTQVNYPQNNQYAPTLPAGYQQNTYPQTAQSYPQTTQGYPQTTQVYGQTSQAGYSQTTQAGCPQTYKGYPPTTQHQVAQNYPPTTQADYSYQQQAKPTQAGYPAAGQAYPTSQGYPARYPASQATTSNYTQNNTPYTKSQTYPASQQYAAQYGQYGNTGRMPTSKEGSPQPAVQPPGQPHPQQQGTPSQWQGSQASYPNTYQYNQYGQQYQPSQGASQPFSPTSPPVDLPSPLQPLRAGGVAHTPSPVHTPVSTPSAANTPSPQHRTPLERQNSTSTTSSLDDILSSSPDREAEGKKPVLQPKVITAEDRAREKEEELKTSITHSTKDPYLMKDVLDRFIAEVEKFDKHVEALFKQTLSGPTPLEKEWRELNEAQEKSAKSHSMAIARCYPLKNRNPDIMPYDQNRVVLVGGKDDYINATYVGDLAPSCPKLVTTQSPLPATTADFWQMVYEQNVEVVVMLCYEQEMGKHKIHMYWPTEKGNAMQHGQLTISLQSERQKQFWTERIIQINHRETRQSRTVVHIQFLHWPPSGSPSSPAQLLSFINEVHSFYTQQRSLLRPVIVHCSDGVGRTGAFSVIYTCVQEIEQGHGIKDIPELIKTLRSKQRHMVSDHEQLKFTYQCVLYHCQDKLMRRGILTNKATFNDKIPGPGEKSHQRKPSEDFILGTTSSLSAIQSSVAKMSVKAQTPPLQDRQDGQAQAEVNGTLQHSEATNGGGTTQLMTSPESEHPPPDASGEPMSPVGNSSLSGSIGSIHSIGAQVAAPMVADAPRNCPEAPLSLEDLQNPNTFRLDSPSSKKRITKSAFLNKTSGLAEELDPTDPFSSLDPTWAVKPKN